MTTAKTRLALLAVGLGGLGLAFLVQMAGATHPRPVSATPLQVSLVPAYERCTSANRTHGPPLDSPSCSPPVQASDYLTVGTADANGAAPRSRGFVRVDVTSGGEDVRHFGRITDVRCRPATAGGVCHSANSAAGADYSGDLQGNATIRLTDHYNGPDRTEAATVQDLPNPILFRCVSTPDKSIGATCTVDTSRPLTPQPYWYTGKRVVSGFTAIQVFDGGEDGNVFTDPEKNTLFAVQGVFVP